MTPVDVFLLILEVAFAIYFIGHSFIEAYFEGKEELMDKMFEVTATGESE